MRLGQLARKYDISSQEIISFINKIDPTHPALHNNSKLEEQLEAVVIKHFDEFLGLTSEPLEVVEQNIIEEEHGEKNPDLNDPVLSDDQEDEVEELTQSDPDPIQEPAETLEAPEAKGESIDTDRLLELLDSEDGDVDLSNITLIKAPKKELSGLKVVGKIELKEPKVKSKENKASEEKDTASERKNSRQFRGLSEEEREERRLRAKQKKQAYEARQERRQLEQEEKLRKAKRQAHYQQRLEQAKSNSVKQRANKIKETIVSEVYEPQIRPKTIFGRLWKWLNSY